MNEQTSIKDPPIIFNQFFKSKPESKENSLKEFANIRNSLMQNVDSREGAMVLNEHPLNKLNIIQDTAIPKRQSAGAQYCERRKSLFQDLNSIQRIIHRKSIYDTNYINGKITPELPNENIENLHPSAKFFEKRESQFKKYERSSTPKSNNCLKGICKCKCSGRKYRRKLKKNGIEENDKLRESGDMSERALNLDIENPARSNRFANLSPRTKSSEIQELWMSSIEKVISQQRVINLLKRSNEPKEKGDRNKGNKRMCLIWPTSKFKFIWTFVVIILLLYTAIITPFIISFIDIMPFELFLTEVIVDSLFFMDIIFTFFTPYEEKDKLITDKRKIAINYITTWLFPDLLACFPFWIFEDDSTSSSKRRYNKLLRLFRLSRLSRLVRLLRLTRLAKILPWTTGLFEKLMIMIKFHPGIGRLLRALIKLSFMIHLFSCLFYFLAKLEQFHPDTWVVRLGLLDSDIFTQYLFSLYWVFQTMTTVGFGDVPPRTNLEILMSLMVMAIGIGTYSYMMGNTSSILTHIDGRKRKLQEKIIALIEFAKAVNLPLEVTLKIKHHLENHHTSVLSSVEQETLLKDLPTSLRAEILSHTHKSLLEKILFLRGKSSKFLWKILPLMKPIRTYHDEFIFRDGDIADEVFFVLNGSVRFVDNTGHIFKIYTEGHYFGEIDILEHTSRSYSAIANEDCELLLINKLDYLELLESYPKFKEQVLDMVVIRKTEYKLEIKSAIKMEKSERKSIMEINNSSNLFNQEFLSKNKMQLTKAKSLRILSISSSGISPLNKSEDNMLRLPETLHKSKTMGGTAIMKNMGNYDSEREVGSEDEIRRLGGKRTSRFRPSSSGSSSVDLYQSEISSRGSIEEIKEEKKDLNKAIPDVSNGFGFIRGLTFNPNEFDSKDGQDNEGELNPPLSTIRIHQDMSSIETSNLFPSNLTLPNIPRNTSCWAQKVNLPHKRSISEHRKESPGSSKIRYKQKKANQKYKLIDFRQKSSIPMPARSKKKKPNSSKNFDTFGKDF